MKTSFKLSFLLLLALTALSEAALASSLFRVRRVSDGDTIVLADGRRVRYIGINAPEVAKADGPAERFGPEARAFNQALVHEKEVRLAFDREKYDQYGRVLAYVFLKDNTFVNAELVKSGCAYCLSQSPNTKYDSLLLSLQQEAMAKRVGMWGTYPNKPGPFLGNRRSKRFHQMTCPFGSTTAPKNRIIFKTGYDAHWMGYSPCKRCFRGQ
jgi:micrococcal nuclease